MSPHVEAIFSAVFRSIQGIRQADGYNFTPALVQRYDRRETTHGTGWEISLWRATEEKTIFGDPDVGGTWHGTMTLQIDGVISAAEDDLQGRTTDELELLLQTDIERALYRVDWAGLRAHLGSISTTSFVNGFAVPVEDGITMNVSIQFGHAGDDPSQAREP